MRRPVNIRTIQLRIKPACKLARLLALLVACTGLGCPICHTQTGAQVRAGIFNASFGMKLLAIASPFPLFAGLVAWLYCDRPARGHQHSLKTEQTGQLKTDDVHENPEDLK